jgi:RND family efflux transporter MFP subunit
MTIRHRWTLCGALAASLWAGTLSAAEIEGFTEPYRDLEVAASDTGIIASIDVKEGDRVQKDQILGTLDQKLLNATLEIADKSKGAKGRINSAQADIRMKAERAEKLQQLLTRKHASQEEVDRSVVEKEVAQAQLLAVQEELVVRALEYDRIKIQIEQRIVRSPIDGVVVRMHRDVGEFVSGNDPVVATIVQLDPLIATYSIPSIFTKEIKPNEEVNILIGEGKTATKGTVDYIAPVTDAQSGTIQVKVRVPNPNNVFRSGEKCLLVVKGELPKTETAGQTKDAQAPAKAAPAPKPAVKTSQLQLGRPQ